ncbi:MAG: Fic family protein [Clostridia bacterium]|nr:Fic family protein [Clostridia bacterium]
MSYQTLRKIYYKDNDHYDQEYNSRFTSEGSVKLDFYVGKNQAFFLMTSEAYDLLVKIYMRNHDVFKLCKSLPGMALYQYSKKCLIDEIVITNSIEGVHSSRKEIGEALSILENQANQKKGKKSRFAGLVNKYLKLLKEETIRLYECKDVRDLYDEVFLEEVIHEDPDNMPDGELFRKGPVSVVSATGKILHSGILPESKIIEYMNIALKFLNDDSVVENDLIRICIFHYLLEYIHPFYDGNGRLGRLILSYGLSNSLYYLIAFRISETIKENINAFYKAFKECNDPLNRGDLTPFLLMQLDMIFLSMDELIESLEKKKDTLTKYQRIIDHLFSANGELHELYYILIQATLFSENGIQMSDITEITEKSVYLTKKVMSKIPDELLDIKKKGNAKYYNLDLKVLESMELDKE